MREWFRKYGKWATGTETALSLGEKLVYALTTSAASGALLTGFGWFIENWVAGVLLGLGGFALLQIILTVRAIRQPEAGLVKAPLAQSLPPRQEASRQLSRPTPSASYPWATDEELKQTYIHNRSLYIFDLVRKNVTMKGKAFEDCQIYGPAIVAPYYGEWPFDDACTWEEASHIPSLLWGTTPELDRKYIGAIGLEDCSFRNCNFIRVGMLVSPDRYEYMTGLPAPHIATDGTSSGGPTDEELKQHCLELADRLHQFLEERGHGDLDDPMNPETRRREDETMRLYRRHFGGEVKAVFAALEQRGWWQPETLDEKKRKHIEDPGHPFSVQDVAQHLSAAGHRL